MTVRKCDQIAMDEHEIDVEVCGAPIVERRHKFGAASDGPEIRSRRNESVRSAAELLEVGPVVVDGHGVLNADSMTMLSTN